MKTRLQVSASEAESLKQSRQLMRGNTTHRSATLNDLLTPKHFRGHWGHTRGSRDTLLSQPRIARLPAPCCARLEQKHKFRSMEGSDKSEGIQQGSQTNSQSYHRVQESRWHL